MRRALSRLIAAGVLALALPELSYAEGQDKIYTAARQNSTWSNEVSTFFLPQEVTRSLLG
jgi:hypothetical protein